MSTEILESTDLSVFTEIIESISINPKCEGDGCEKDADIAIMCPECSSGDKNSGELSCYSCYDNMMVYRMLIIFNGSCGDAASIVDCPTRPI